MHFCKCLMAVFRRAVYFKPKGSPNLHLLHVQPRKCICISLTSTKLEIKWRRWESNELGLQDAILHGVCI